MGKRHEDAWSNGKLYRGALLDFQVEKGSLLCVKPQCSGAVCEQATGCCLRNGNGSAWVPAEGWGESAQSTGQGFGVPRDSEHWDSAVVKSPAHRAGRKIANRAKHGKKDPKILRSAVSRRYRTAEERGWKQEGPEETQASPPEQGARKRLQQRLAASG